MGFVVEWVRMKGLVFVWNMVYFVIGDLIVIENCSGEICVERKPRKV